MADRDDCPGGQVARPYPRGHIRPDGTPSKGTCPSCGRWSVAVNVDGNVRKHKRMDQTNVSQALARRNVNR